VEAILDCSAVIAALEGEPGHEIVDAALAAGAGICTANIAEIMTILVRGGTALAAARQAIVSLPVTTFDLDVGLSLGAGAMAAITRRFGLSLGDRICLALAARENLPALTADRVWEPAGREIGVAIRLIR
jgi:ribonuclease VapC